MGHKLLDDAGIVHAIGIYRFVSSAKSPFAQKPNHAVAVSEERREVGLAATLTKFRLVGIERMRALGIRTVEHIWEEMIRFKVMIYLLCLSASSY